MPCIGRCAAHQQRVVVGIDQQLQDLTDQRRCEGDLLIELRHPNVNIGNPVNLAETSKIRHGICR